MGLTDVYKEVMKHDGSCRTTLVVQLKDDGYLGSSQESGSIRTTKLGWACQASMGRPRLGYVWKRWSGTLDVPVPVLSPVLRLLSLTNGLQ